MAGPTLMGQLSIWSILFIRSDDIMQRIRTEIYPLFTFHLFPLGCKIPFSDVFLRMRSEGQRCSRPLKSVRECFQQRGVSSCLYFNLWDNTKLFLWLYCVSVLQSEGNSLTHSGFLQRLSCQEMSGGGGRRHTWRCLSDPCHDSVRRWSPQLESVRSFDHHESSPPPVMRKNTGFIL